VITKLTDPATPKLYAALVTNEVLTDAKLTFWGPAPAPTDPSTRAVAGPAGGAPYLTIELSGSRSSG
jgi:hypothetical protein